MLFSSKGGIRMKYDVTSHALGAHTLSVFRPRTEQHEPAKQAERAVQ